MSGFFLALHACALVLRAPHLPQHRFTPRHAPLHGAETDGYNAEQITVLEGLEPVRKRPGMYIGSTGPRGLHHLVYEVVDNSVDEALAGHATAISVTIHECGGVTVVDNGRGIPCDTHTKTGKSALETVLTVLHAGGKFGDSGYKVSSGLHGVGVSVVNALSEELRVEVLREGQRHTMEFRQGVVVKPLETTAMAGEAGSGTRIYFRPDRAIFKSEEGLRFDPKMLSTRFDEQAYLNAGLNISLIDETQQPPKTVHFCHAGGIKEYIRNICVGKTALFTDPDTLAASRSSHGVHVDVALRWNSDMYTDSIIAFANGVHTPNGGSHVDGLKFAISKVLNAQARATGKVKEKAASLSGDFLREGLCAIISVKMQEAEFEGQTKTRLGNPEVRPIVSDIVCELLLDELQRRPKVLTLILDKAMAAAKAALAAKAARDLVRRKTVLGTSVLPGKLADCACTNAAESEVFIVEGDSAGGSAKQGRRREFQAVLPLRGKILNVEKADDAQMYGNTEIQALITCLGLGIKGDEFSPSQLRYHRVILMTDADVDGAHIRTLLLTFLFRYQRRLVEDGFVYIAYPPLYKVKQRQKVSYCYTDAELNQLVASSSSKVTMQRFKGLGEMMPDELWKTTMDPETRKLKQVTVEDAAEADRIFSVLMGSNIAPRKHFITEHAETLDWAKLDV
ncbi:hypothetical protein AB1Y20_022110 [Prymnesium parvum]|uniref:DNA topoisomerase 2 n=1 Tax=Prymnesium parvum TaxID=97485 RepID=A0AB34JG65_PRYPA